MERKEKEVQLSLCTRPSWLSKGQMQPQTVAAVTGVLAADSSCFLFEDEENLKNLRINRLAANSLLCYSVHLQISLKIPEAL